MAVYVDDPVWKWRGTRWCHLTADSTDELNAFADRLGLRRGWLQCKPGRPWHDHYDIPSDAREKAIALGALPLTMREMGERQARRRASLRAAGH